MIITFEPIPNSFRGLENTFLYEGRDENNILQRYKIIPKEGYAMHDATLDEEVVDKETLEPTGQVIKRYRYDSAIVRADYNFNDIEIFEFLGTTGTYYALYQVGDRKLYVVPRNEVEIDE